MSKKNIRKTIFTIPQGKAIEFGLNLEDLLILNWFVTYKDGNKMKRKHIESINDMGYWVDYDYLIQQLPIIFQGANMKANKQKLKRILSGALSKFLIRDTKRSEEKGTKIFIALNRETYSVLMGFDDDEEKEEETKVQKCTVDPTTKVQKCTLPKYKNVPSEYMSKDTCPSYIYSSSKEDEEQQPKINELQLKSIMKHCQLCNYRLQKKSAIKLLATYDFLTIQKAISKASENENVKSPMAYLQTILIDMEKKKEITIIKDGKQGNTSDNFEGRRNEPQYNDTLGALENAAIGGQ